MMAKALNEATGLTFEVSVPTSYAATIEEMCASPTDTMAFIPAFGYVLANDCVVWMLLSKPSAVAGASTGRCSSWLAIVTSNPWKILKARSGVSRCWFHLRLPGPVCAAEGRRHYPR